MSDERQNRYQRNLTLIQIYSGAFFTIGGFVMAVGLALLILGRTYLDSSAISPPEEASGALLAAAFGLLSNGFLDLLAGAGTVIGTVVLGGYFTNREFNRANQ